MRLALARRASVPQPLGRASGRQPGAALLARCTAQSCDNKRGGSFRFRRIAQGNRNFTYFNRIKETEFFF